MLTVKIGFMYAYVQNISLIPFSQIMACVQNKFTCLKRYQSSFFYFNGTCCTNLDPQHGKKENICTTRLSYQVY